MSKPEWEMVAENCDRLLITGGWIYRTWETPQHPDCTIGWQAPWQAPQRVQLCAVFVPKREGGEP